MLIAWIVFPLLLLAICVGLGLLVDALGGRRLPGALIAPAGLAALVVVVQLMTLVEATAPYAASLAIVAAGIGVVASLPWRFGRPDPWAAGAALAAFLLFAAPILLSGHPTFAAYGSLADIPTWPAIAERAMEHGRDLEGLDPSTYRANLDATLGAGDPIGAVLPLAAAQRLLNGEIAWTLQPYLAFLGALIALCAWQLLRAAGISPPIGGEMPGTSEVSAPSTLPGAPLAPGPRALLAFLTAVPALVFGYAGWGGVQELAAATLLAVAAALVLGRPHGETHTAGNGSRMRFTPWVLPTIVVLALLCVLAPWPPSFPLQADAWLATLALAALIAATLALGLRLAAIPPASADTESARARPPLALSLFAAALLAPAVIASAGVSLAPYEELEELRDLDARFAEEGPALVFEQTPYGSHYFLRDVPPDRAEDPATAPLSLAATNAESMLAEPDDVEYRSLLAYPLLVVPRSPEQSRPPSPYRLAELGEDYSVWRLPSTATFRLLFHMPIGGPLNAIGLPDCSQTVGLGLLALAGQLGAAPQDILIIASPPPRSGRPQPTVAVPPDRARELCGRRWDWIEAISPGG